MNDSHQVHYLESCFGSISFEDRRRRRKALNKKRFNKQNFKEFHPSGSLGTKLKTVEDIMISGNGIPFIEESLSMKKALNLITKKKLGVLIVVNKKKLTTGIITDGQIRRSSQKNNNLKLLRKNTPHGSM